MMIAAALLICGIASSCLGGQQAPEGQWTGGFVLDGKWTAVNVRFNDQSGAPAGTADIVFPDYGGGENAINVALNSVRLTAAGLHFEIPVGSRNAVFDGRQTGDTITGKFVFRDARGTFGLTRVAIVTAESLAKYYGAYRVSPDRVISILRGWNYSRTLNFVDYKTGKVGTLWPSSENSFFSGTGLAGSFPVALTAAFKTDAAGRVTRLVWQPANEAKFTAERIPFIEERLRFRNGDVTLGGTLILPPTKGRHAVVIVTPGDYGTNRDQLRLWAHNYVSEGIGAFIFDARGGGESQGSPNSSSFSELANDVLAAVEVLRKRSDVNPKQIGLFGFSNSAFTVTLAASRSKNVSFLILQSFVGVVGWKQESFRAEAQLRADHFPESVVKQGADFMRLKFEVGRTGRGWEQLEAVMERARDERWLAYTNPPNDLERWRQRYQSVMTYDPVPALEKLHIPILAIWGDKDTNLPVSETVANFKRAMAKAGNRNYVIRIYPGTSHSLLVTDSGSPSSGGTEEKFAPGLWKMTIDWVRNAR